MIATPMKKKRIHTENFKLYKGLACIGNPGNLSTRNVYNNRQAIIDNNLFGVFTEKEILVTVSSMFKNVIIRMCVMQSHVFCDILNPSFYGKKY